MPSHESALVTAAKRLARAQMKRRKARKALREIEAEIKLARKFLRATMVSALNAPDVLDDGTQLPPRNGRQIRRRQK